MLVDFKLLKTIKALGLRPRAFIRFLVFQTLMKHSHSFLKCYLAARLDRQWMKERGIIDMRVRTNWPARLVHG